MKIKSVALMAAAIGALGLTSPASASPARSAAAAERVAYDDLDLVSAEGQRELQRRVDRAAWKVCMFDEAGQLRENGSHVKCYRTAREQVAVQVAQAVSKRPLLGG